jgi:hypothetical protein
MEHTYPSRPTRRFARLLAALGLLLAMASAAQAQVFSGELTTASPLFNRPAGSATPPTALTNAGSSFYYQVITITVSTPGSYIFRGSSGFDNFGVLYSSAGFSPNAPLTNAIQSSDDANGSLNFSISQTLSAGTYYLVFTSFNLRETGTFTLTASGPAAVVLAATPVAPTTVADSYTTPVGVTLTGNVLTNDLGTNPRAILINRPANGTLVLNPDGSFSYRPNAGFVGTDTFTYYACNQGTPLVCGNPATVTITVTRVAPTTVADNYTTPQGTPLTGNVLSNDLGTNPRAILITRPINGTLVLNPDGSFRYVPNAGFSGTDTFTYYACDPNQPLLCGNPATVTITVTRVAPTTVADSYSTPQGVTLTGNVLTNDLGTNPRAILINRPTNGTLVLNPDGSFRYVPNAGFSGTDTFTYYACDPAMPLLCGNPATVTITVTRVAPITVADAYTVPAGVTLRGNVLTNDIGTNPRAILLTRPTRGTLVLNPDGSFTYVSNAGLSGTDSFTYYACDPNQPLFCGNPATVTITVTGATPVTVADSYSAPQGRPLGGNVLTNDLGTNLRAILLTRPYRGIFSLDPNGSFIYVPNTSFLGTDSFTYYACNQGTPLVCGNPATVTITMTFASTATRVAAQSTAAAAAQPATPAPPTAPAVGGVTIALELALAGHPNPFADELQLSFALPLAQAYNLALYDAQGRLVRQLSSGQAEAGQAQQLAVPTHGYAAGLYLVRLTTPTGTRQLKLIKQ